ncbi:hypothetical protein METP2_03039 [Methanosarcinales archaeon]|nr:hypothetical protein METP2_03039 [Methanosarcinales archaeon]
MIHLLSLGVGILVVALFLGLGIQEQFVGSISLLFTTLNDFAKYKTEMEREAFLKRNSKALLKANVKLGVGLCLLFAVLAGPLFFFPELNASLYLTETSVIALFGALVWSRKIRVAQRGKSDR